MTYFNALNDLSKQYDEVRLVLGDQLHAGHSWWQTPCSNILYVMFEMQQELDYVKHHRQKILAFFAAMRNFAKAISHKHDMLYIALDNSDNQQDLIANLKAVIHKVKATKLTYQEPDEYRLNQQLAGIDWIERECVGSEHFFTQRNNLKRYFPKQKSLLMETFYRQLRQDTGYLMNGNKPMGDRWNFDSENRKKLPKNHSLPTPLCFANDVADIEEMLTKQKVTTFGTVDAKRFLWPVNRQQAIELFEYFLEHLFPHFGTFQDAMTESGWSLYHSRISFALNSKILSPQYVIERAIERYKADSEQITLPQVEGFVRQILGWREYVRLIYWHYMPAYADKNELAHTRDLPSFFWNAKTKMRCVSHAIQQSLDYAYAHHIQRLMITGNFALLAGIEPQQVDAWYLGIYIDAIEWVELPNTRGMSQFADGGILATKPYVSGGNYIHKMSHYCAECHYNVAKKHGENSCPFNSLYWHFIDRHRERFEHNHRMRMMYAQWNKRSEEERQAILTQAEYYLTNLEEL
ncbi:MAG: deoxyribodipyrimidine photolyase-related protein [Idiomarinaceae bacterium HL-53]|nr:MAG: deoxyribodipyrimidine photolyase-related protein [Idiomarinaceae bacterium HL-53]CUS48460.1 deoxyribodipyrimidine photolyase-related protein [Idiomarinaceae bacterium HL-53]